MAWVSKLQNMLTCAYADVCLAKYTTIGVGGKCKLFVLPNCEDEICKTIDFCCKNDVSYKVVGNMSNIVVSSDGFDGVVVKIGKNFSGLSVCGDKTTAKAGTSTKGLYNFACQNNFGGTEFLATLPSTVGGAVANNAGCFGCETKDVISRVFATDGKVSKWFDNSQIGFGYRQSNFRQNGFVVLQVEFCLPKCDYQKSKQIYKQLLSKKASTQPLDEKSAGCVFKKLDGVSAGYYIDKCGLKGFCVGDAQISTKHAGFIINKGNATSQEIKQLICFVKEKCKQTFGVTLVPEVEFLENTDDFR